MKLRLALGAFKFCHPKSQISESILNSFYHELTAEGAALKIVVKSPPELPAFPGCTKEWSSYYF